jgi:hypothetical protein
VVNKEVTTRIKIRDELFFLILSFYAIIKLEKLRL